MSKNLEYIAKDVLAKLTAPHIGLTYYQIKTMVASIFKNLNADITIDQFIILKLLSEQKNIQQQDLAQLLNKSKSNFSRMVDILEEKSYLTRQVDFKGKRIIKNLAITEKGMALVDKSTPIVEKVHALAFSGISKEELDSLKNTLAKIRSNLRKKIEL